MKFKWKDFEVECTVDEFEDLFVRGVFDPNLIIGVKRETVHDDEGSHFVPVYGCQIPAVRDLPLNLTVSTPKPEPASPGNSRNDIAVTPVKDEPKCVMVVAPETQNRKTDDTARDEFVHIMDKAHHILTHDTAMWNPELKHNANSAYVVINLDSTRLDEARIFQYLVNGCAHITGDARGAYVVETEKGTSYLICKGFPDKPQYSMKVILFRDQDGITGVHFRFNTEELAESAVTTINIENEPCSPLAQFGEACVRLFPRFSAEEHERIDGERRIAEESVRGVEAAAKKTRKNDKSGVSVW
jgi:hypothetical protein